jgi:hypothetical protein
MRRRPFFGAVPALASSEAGEPICAGWFEPLLREPALVDRYRLVSYHRVGYAGNGRVAGPVSIEQQAAQCQAGRITQPVLAVLGGDSHLVSPVWGERQALLAEALAGRFGRHPLTT